VARPSFLAAVSKCDCVNQRLWLSNGEQIQYNKLLCATGAVPKVGTQGSHTVWIHRGYRGYRGYRRSHQSHSATARLHTQSEHTEVYRVYSLNILLQINAHTYLPTGVWNTCQRYVCTYGCLNPWPLHRFNNTSVNMYVWDLKTLGLYRGLLTRQWYVCTFGCFKPLPLRGFNNASLIRMYVWVFLAPALRYGCVSEPYFGN
jgi:hypothetical protein